MPEKAKRRNNNEGSIRKRSNGLWEAQYIAGYKPDGKPIRRSIYGKSKKEVKTRLLNIKKHLLKCFFEHEAKSNIIFYVSLLKRSMHHT